MDDTIDGLQDKIKLLNINYTIIVCLCHIKQLFKRINLKIHIITYKNKYLLKKIKINICVDAQI